MGDVLEFQSVRLQLHLIMLRHLGVPDTVTWRVIGNPRDRFWDGELYTAPLMVAVRRDGRACTIDFGYGRTPESLPDSRMLVAALDAAVVHRYFERRSIQCSRISSWVVFEDGGRIEVDAASTVLAELRLRAQRAMRDGHLTTTATHVLAEEHGVWLTAANPICAQTGRAVTEYPVRSLRRHPSSVLQPEQP